MLIRSAPSTSKTLAATPGCERMPAPMIETLPIRSSVRTPWLTPPSAAIVSVAVVSSERSMVKERSASSSWPTGSFWMITSTLMPASARAVKISPATPGSSRMPISVTRASSSEWVTAVTKGCSTVSCSASSSVTTRVPGPSSKLLRQWMRTPWLRAYSTERSCRTWAPEAAISSISS